MHDGKYVCDNVYVIVSDIVCDGLVWLKNLKETLNQKILREKMVQNQILYRLSKMQLYLVWFGMVGFNFSWKSQETDFLRFLSQTKPKHTKPNRVV